MSFLIVIILFFLRPAMAASPVQLGGFVDTYYAFDSNTPKSHERDFTTQPSQHNEFNVNLAFLELTHKEEKTRGRLALQTGTSVKRNYVYEPGDSKWLQEAYVGTKISEKTWFDMGIFLGNIGMESWISRDNYTYTRSLLLDYVPYYSAGARFDHEIDKSSSFQFIIMNGWQNISETNQSKAIGMQYRRAFTSSSTFTYNNFFGDERILPGQRDRFRQYHNFIFQHVFSDTWIFLGSFDVGTQGQQNRTGIDALYATSLVLRQNLNRTEALAYRLEHYNDRRQTTVPTGTANGFQVTGASVNFDKKTSERALWRNEVRGFYSKDKIYSQGTGSHKNFADVFFVTSLALTF